MMALTLEDRFALLGGRVSYRELCAGDPPWLTAALTATEAARTKLTTWAAAPRPWTPPAPAEVLKRMHFYGDGLLAHLTARVLAERLPPPVCDYAIRYVTFIGAGVGLLGSCGPPADFADRPFFVLLSADGRRRDAIDRIKNVIAHEVAHAWLNPEPPTGSVAISAFERETLQDVPLDELLVSPASRAFVQAQRAAAARDERVANALTDVWGFRRAAETERT